MASVVIDIHGVTLKHQGWIATDQGGTQIYPVTNAAAKGATTITVSAVPMVGQLLALRGIDGNYFSAIAESVVPPVVTLRAPLEQAVDPGNAWNFYNDEAHPNVIGYNALVDEAITKVSGLPNFATGTHVLLGDSWFRLNRGFPERLTARMPGATFVNKAIGGQTTAQLLARFQTDVTPSRPDFVWIIGGTNDYFSDVPASTYAANIAAIVAATNAIGAVPIVLNSSVGSKDLSQARFDLSEQYAAAVH